MQRSHSNESMLNLPDHLGRKYPILNYNMTFDAREMIDVEKEHTAIRLEIRMNTLDSKRAELTVLYQAVIVRSSYNSRRGNEQTVPSTPLGRRSERQCNCVVMRGAWRSG